MFAFIVIGYGILPAAALTLDIIQWDPKNAACLWVLFLTFKVVGLMFMFWPTFFNKLIKLNNFVDKKEEKKKRREENLKALA